MTTFKRYKVQPEGRNKYGNYYSKMNMNSNITYATHAGNVTTEDMTGQEGSGTDTGTTKQHNYIMFLLTTQGNYNGPDVAVSAQSQTTRLVTYVDNKPEVSYIGNFSNSADTFHGITGYAESGMTINILNNGTSATTIEVIVDNTLNRNQGVLSIPCYMPRNGESGMDGFLDWKKLFDTECVYAQVFEWAWTVSSDATSVFLLDLSNEYAGVNCDSGGTVVPGAILPSAQATLYYGDEALSAATYSYSVPATYHATGITFNTSTGVLSFDNNLAFCGTTMDITITGSYGGVTRSKVFTLVKNMPGANGEPAVTKWLVPSTNSVIRSTSSSSITVSPSAITCSVMMQEGNNAPVDITSSTTIWYKTDQYRDWNTGVSIMIRTDIFDQSYEFALVDGLTMYEHETVPVISNGARGAKGDKGDKGDTGLTGPSIRGPFNFYELGFRRVSNGLGPLAEDKEFIDVIIKDNVYYRCNTSYDTNEDDWDDVSSAWTQSSNYDFVATNLLLAQNAKIDFLTNNALYLKSGNTITGGAQGGSGDTIAFWAGNTLPNSAPFRVTHNGEIYAKSGVFAGYVQMPYVSVFDLASSTTPTSQSFTADTRAYIIDPGGLAPNLPNGRTIWLPPPSSGLNGFIYYILCRGWRAAMQTQSETYNTYIKIQGNLGGMASCVNSYWDTDNVWNKIGLYSGLNEITCVYLDGAWRWALTSAPTGAYLENATKFKWFKTKYDENEGNL